MTRGVIYMVWEGYESRVQTALDRSIASLKIEHPELPYEVFTLPEGSTLLDKATMLDLTPFDSTLFLDADTVVLGNLDYGFRKAEQFGLAMTICECPWARRYAGLADRGDIIEFNTGVMFFTRGVREVFDAWKCNTCIDSSVRFMSKEGEKTMPLNDQAAFALAIDDTGFNPWVLPLNWNFRPLWQKTVFGPIRIWHDYSAVPDNVLKWNDEQSSDVAVINCARVAT